MRLHRHTAKLLASFALLAGLHTTASANIYPDIYFAPINLSEDEVLANYKFNGPTPHKWTPGPNFPSWPVINDGGPSPANWVTYESPNLQGENIHAFQFEQGMTQRYSVYFYYDTGSDATFAGPTSVAAVGFAANGISPGEGAGTAFRIQAAGGSAELLPEIRNNGQTIVPAGATPFTLNDATWYRLTTDFTKWGDGLYAYSFQLDRFGTNTYTYSTLEANVFVYAGTLFNAGNDTENRALAFYGGAEADGTGNLGFSFNAVDSFAAAPIPEPSSAVALAGLGALGLAALRRPSKRSAKS